MNALTHHTDPSVGAPRVPGRLLTLLSAVLLFAVSACGGGGSAPEPVASEPAPVEEKGDVFVAITDAEGDFVSYAVDVRSITLVRANGSVVETLPFTTRIDFTELTEVTEFLSIATVPAGVYESAVFSVDYTDADIVVQDENGDERAAQVVDADGNALGQLDVTLNLSQSDLVRIAPGVPAAFSLDFDLDASNEIDLTAAVPVVTVDPFLLATAELEGEREHRVRGALDAVEASANQFVLNVRPFRHRVGQFGQFTVTTTETTQFEVDGVGYTGNEGLTALEAVAEAAPVIANGSISGRSITADTVVAGSSVPWTDGTVVKGVVSARSGDELTVRGARVEYDDGVEIFRGEGTVILGGLTTVTAPGVDNATLDSSSVSVGQRIVAFGELVDEQTLDASEGRVVMQMNQMTARVNTPDPLNVEVYLLNGRRAEIFDFSGTGMDASVDADAAQYEIDTATLSLDGLAADQWVRVRGLVNAFGQAPADFNAQTVINVDVESRPGVLTVIWPEGSATPFHSITESAIDIDLTDSRETLNVRGVPRVFTNPLQSALLTADDDGVGVYAVKVRGSAELNLYRDFASLTDALNQQLAEGAQLYRVTAQVRYTAEDDALETPRASFVLRAPGE